jgi:hypothetical protein
MGGKNQRITIRLCMECCCLINAGEDNLAYLSNVCSDGRIFLSSVCQSLRNITLLTAIGGISGVLSASILSDS